MRCRVCRSDRWEPTILVGDVRYRTTERAFEIVRCGECRVLATRDGAGYVSPENFYPQEYGAFREASVPTSSPLPRRSHLRWASRAATDRRSWLQHVDRSPGRRMLDVGCGNGVAAAHLRDFFSWTVAGIEPSEQGADVARRHGFPVHHGTLDDFESDERYDLVSLIHVLEHVPDPQAAVRRVTELLAPGGQIVIAVPNAESLERRMFGDDWDAWDVPRHVHHFGPTSLRRLVLDAGFVVEHVDFECYTVAGRSLANRRYRELPYHERKEHCRAPKLEKHWGRMLAILRCSSAIQLVGRMPT